MSARGDPPVLLALAATCSSEPRRSVTDFPEDRMSGRRKDPMTAVNFDPGPLGALAAEQPDEEFDRPRGVAGRSRTGARPCMGEAVGEVPWDRGTAGRRSALPGHGCMGGRGPAPLPETRGRDVQCSAWGLPTLVAMPEGEAMVEGSEGGTTCMPCVDARVGWTATPVLLLRAKRWELGLGGAQRSPAWELRFMRRTVEALEKESFRRSPKEGRCCSSCCRKAAELRRGRGRGAPVLDLPRPVMLKPEGAGWCSDLEPRPTACRSELMRPPPVLLLVAGPVCLAGAAWRSAMEPRRAEKEERRKEAARVREGVRFSWPGVDVRRALRLPPAPLGEDEAAMELSCCAACSLSQSVRVSGRGGSAAMSLGREWGGPWWGEVAAWSWWVPVDQASIKQVGRRRGLL